MDISNPSTSSDSFNPEIIYEDSELLAINKPAGVVVNQSSTAKDQTVQSWFFQRLGGMNTLKETLKDDEWIKMIPSDFSEKYGTPQEIFKQRQGLVHRLDKDTSGILILAKNPGSLVNLLAQFRQREVKKKYLCLVHGKMKVDSTSIKAPIARSRVDRHKFTADIEGRTAVTHYRVVKFFSTSGLMQLIQESDALSVAKLKKELNSYQQGFSLLECLLETGRTHQIRVHLAHIGHPIVADGTYGGGRRSALDKKWCSRQFLHAAALEVRHPKTGKRMVLKANLTDDLQNVIEKFE